MANHSNINGLIRIKNGKLQIELLNDDKGPIKEDITKLTILRDIIVGDELQNFEKNYQKKLAEGQIEYKLPDDIYNEGHST